MVDEPDNELRVAVETLFPRLTYYYHMGYAELAVLPRWVLLAYAGALPQLNAEAEALQVRAASYAHLKKSDQRSSRSDLNRRLKGASRTRLQTPQLLDAASGIGIGVRYEGVEQDEE